MSDNMLITSGSSFEGYKIEEYLGFVSGHSILGSNFMSGIAANVTDVARKDTAKLEQCREDAGAKIRKAAEKKGANAIIGVSMNYAPFERPRRDAPWRPGSAGGSPISTAKSRRRPAVRWQRSLKTKAKRPSENGRRRPSGRFWYTPTPPSCSPLAAAR